MHPNNALHKPPLSCRLLRADVRNRERIDIRHEELFA